MILSNKKPFNNFRMENKPLRELETVVFNFSKLYLTETKSLFR